MKKNSAFLTLTGLLLGGFVFHSCKKNLDEPTAVAETTASAATVAISKLVVTSVTAPSYAKYPLSNLTDGNLQTIWSAENAPGAYPPDPNSQVVTIRLDTTALQTISYLKLAVFTGNTAVQYAFDVQVSADAKSWTTVLTNQKNTPRNAALTMYDFADTQGKYLRVIGHGNNGSYPKANSYTELEVYGIPAFPSVAPCHIKGLVQPISIDDVHSTVRLGYFYYNVYNTLDSVIFSAPGNISQYDRYVFDHDASHRITHLRAYMANFPTAARNFTYTWSNGRITKVVSTSDPVANTGTDITYYDSVFYDAQGRAVRDSVVGIIQFHYPKVPDTLRAMPTYAYDGSGNQVHPGLTYDNKTCYLTTDPFLQFLVRDYSRNNCIPARGYTVKNLPVGFTASFPYAFENNNFSFFGSSDLRSITYTCQP